MPTATPTHSESLELFFGQLAGGAGPGEFLELRHRLAVGEGMGKEFVAVARSRTLASRALGTGRYTDVYVGCAPRLGRRGGRDGVQAAWVAWADLDRPGADEALERFALRPSAVVASGSGENRHVYFCLAESLGGGEVELLNRRLAAALGADDGAVTNPAAILRPPFTRNHKHATPTPVRLLELEPERRYSLAELDDALPRLRPEQTPAPRRPGASQRQSGTDDPLLRLEPRVYVSELLGRAPGRDGKVACPFHADENPSLHVFRGAQRGWFCFSCRRGTSIYDLAGPLLGFATRGRDFVELRRELGRRFGLDVDEGGPARGGRARLGPRSEVRRRSSTAREQPLGSCRRDRLGRAAVPTHP